MSGAGNGGQVSRGVQAALKKAPSGRAARGLDDPAGLPAFAQVGGVEIAIVDAGEYRALRALRDAVGKGGSKQLTLERPRRRRLSRLDKDPEVRNFIMSRVQSADVDDVRKAAIVKFGLSRVPCYTSVCDFVRRDREERQGDV
ncbi:MAG: hypothetical protein PGN25_22240 [Methylorubrum populi]